MKPFILGTRIAGPYAFLIFYQVVFYSSYIKLDFLSLRRRNACTDPTYRIDLRK
jgi:hypothetical protein